MREGWEIKKLGTVSKINYGYTESATFQEIGPKFLRITDIQDNYVNWTLVPYCKIKSDEIERFLLKKGDIVFARTGATTGKSYLIKETPLAVFASYLIRVQISKLDELVPEFLYLFFQTKQYWDKIQDGLSGSAQGGFNASKLSELSIPIPPLSEQQRIVSILDEAFAAIVIAKQNAERNLQNAKELFETYLQTVFLNKKVGWEEMTLGDVCSLHQGIAINAKTKHALVPKSDLPLLRIKDLKNNSEEQYIDPKSYPVNALIKESDIIYTRTGSLGLVFRGRRGVLHNNSFKVTPNQKLESDYLFIWLQNPTFKSKIMALALKATQPDISHAIFKIQEIAIPPLEEQKLIVKNLNRIKVETTKLEVIYNQKLLGLEELKKTILQKAFAGELTNKEIPELI